MQKRILIFGGSGFIGCELVYLLLKNNFLVTVVCSNLTKAQKCLPKNPNLTIKVIDIFHMSSLKAAIENSDFIVNLIGKLYEVKKNDFYQFHTHFPSLLASVVKENQRLIHISALGIELSCKTSIYAKTKLDGEMQICQNSKNYSIIRPSVVFGNRDNFFNLFSRMSKFSPFLPLIGGGKTEFMPIYVGDLVNAIFAIIKNQNLCHNNIMEAAGPDLASFKSIIEFILNTKQRKRILINLPFAIAKLEARLINLFKIMLLTCDQVELLKYNNKRSDKYDNIDTIIGNLTSYKTIKPYF